MNIRFQAMSDGECRADAFLFFGLSEPAAKLPGFERFLRETGPWPAESRILGDFKGKAQETAVLHAADETSGPGAPERVLLLGLGARKKLDLDALRLTAARAATEARRLGLKTLGLPLSALEGLPFARERALEETLIGLRLGLYSYGGKKPAEDEDENPNLPAELVLLTDEEPDQSLKDAAAWAMAAAEGVCLARELVNTPANIATPTYLAETAMDLAQAHGFRAEVLDREELERMGMGCFAAVFRGSREPAKLIVLESAPEGMEKDRPIVFVGKGVTFDTGGISLKPAAKMDEMKSDMGGAAAILGFFEAWGRVGARRRVIGVMPCTENMPDGCATKPGDVATSLSGKTVEIINTDAEGRLILCDALTHAQGFEPILLADIATLTGACVVALGPDVAAVFSNREKLPFTVQRLGLDVGERYWPMPLWEHYDEVLKSPVADMKNVGPREGGAIHAAKFLQRFVPGTQPWIHLDIAGPSYRGKKNALCGEGGSGVGVRLFLELVRRFEEVRELLEPAGQEGE